jgi:hypothetical protein
MLTDMAYKALSDKLREKFELADQPGPGVLRIRAALTEAKGANVLAAAVDSLAGTKGVLRAFSKWADVQNACNRWAERTRDFLVKQGVRTIASGGASVNAGATP